MLLRRVSHLVPAFPRQNIDDVEGIEFCASQYHPAVLLVHGAGRVVAHVAGVQGADVAFIEAWWEERCKICGKERFYGDSDCRNIYLRSDLSVNTSLYCQRDCMG